MPAHINKSNDYIHLNEIIMRYIAIGTFYTHDAWKIMRISVNVTER